MEKNWTGERLETFVYNENMVEHLHRYSFAAKYVIGKDVLDIACGEGYGTKLMSIEAKHVWGVDISSETIDAAQRKYVADNISFKKGSADKIPLDANTIDVVVSFETLEHHNKHMEMLAEIKRVLRPGGILIMSSPDKKYYTDETGYANKFHVKELYFWEFQQLIAGYFKYCNFLKQRFIGGSIILADTHRSDEFEIHSGNYDKLNIPTQFTPMYNLVIASDDTLDSPADSIFTADEWYAMLIKNITTKMTSSFTWKVGSFFVKPVSYLKNLLIRN